MTDDVPPSVKIFFPESEPVWPKACKAKASVQLNRIDQIAILVNDIDDAIEYYGAAFGWGPFYIGYVENQLQYKGQLSDVKLKLAFVLVGGIEIELLQPIEGDTPHHDHLRERGEGLLHLRLATEDINAALAQLADQGIEPIFGYKTNDKWVNVYVNSDQKFGARAELILNQNELGKLLNSLDYSWNKVE